MLQIREHRKAQGLSVEALAYHSSLSYKTIVRIEQTRSANSRSLTALADALGLKVGDLFEAPKGNGRKRRAS